MTLRTNVLEIVTTYAHDDRSVVILHRFADDTYIVGKNYRRIDNEIEWCWGTYDLPTVEIAQKIALAYIFER